jgi:hypothetical protein
VAAVATSGETSQSVSRLRCGFPDGLPGGLGLLREADGELTLGRGNGVVLRYHRMFGAGHALIRRP